MRILATTLILSSTLALSLPATAADHKIQMIDIDEADNIMIFDPPYIKINKGDTVTFVAKDPGHNIISRHIPPGRSLLRAARRLQMQP